MQQNCCADFDEVSNAPCDGNRCEDEEERNLGLRGFDFWADQAPFQPWTGKVRQPGRFKLASSDFPLSPFYVFVCSCFPQKPCAQKPFSPLTPPPPSRPSSRLALSRVSPCKTPFLQVWYNPLLLVLPSSFFGTFILALCFSLPTYLPSFSVFLSLMFWERAAS